LIAGELLSSYIIWKTRIRYQGEKKWKFDSRKERKTYKEDILGLEIAMDDSNFIQSLKI